MLEQFSGSRLTGTTVSYPIVGAMVASTFLATVASFVSISMAHMLAILVAAVLVIGPAAAIGGTVGIVVHDLLWGAVGYWTASTAMWLLVFAGLVSLLVPVPFHRRDSRPSGSFWQAVQGYAGAAIVAGILATAVAAWVAFVLGGQRFYTTVGLLGAIPVAVAAGMPILAFRYRTQGQRSDDTTSHTPRATGAASNPTAKTQAPRHDGGVPNHERQRPSRWTVFGLLFIGLAWLVGGIGFDVLAHDFALFPTELALREYAADMVGTGSPIATVASVTLIGVYRYGESAVYLSAPIVASAVWLLYRRTTVYRGGIR